MSLDKESNAEFSYFKEWNLYHTIVKINAMFHRELYDSIRDTFPRDTAFTLCDLGCGSSDYISKILSTKKCVHYTGVDMSQSALEYSAKILNAYKNITPAYVQTDMISFLKCAVSKGQKFDMIFSGFAVHHLSSSDKETLLTLISQALNPQGRFILIDIFLPERHLKSYYFDTLMSYYYARLKDSLSQEEIDATKHHNETFDFPEYLEFYETLSQKIGFQFKVFERIEGYFSSCFQLI